MSTSKEKPIKYTCCGGPTATGGHEPHCPLLKQKPTEEKWLNYYRYDKDLKTYTSCGEEIRQEIATSRLALLKRIEAEIENGKVWKKKTLLELLAKIKNENIS